MFFIDFSLDSRNTPCAGSATRTGVEGWMKSSLAVRSMFCFGVLWSCLIAGIAHAEGAALRISTSPPLAIASQTSEGRRTFALSEPSQFTLRVEAVDEGTPPRDISSTCNITSASPLASVGQGHSISIASAAESTLAAIVVECPEGRELVLFLLSPSAQE
jgi:hypothetical protein